MIATFRGRLQTKALTYVILAATTAVFAWWSGTAYWLLGGIAMVIGLLLESMWGWLIEYQPGWLTFVLGCIEFLVIANVAVLLGAAVPMMHAMGYYLASWVIIQLFLLYLLPVWRTNWRDNGAELW